jgi:glutamine synthetase
MIVITEYIWLNQFQKICSKSKVINININIKDKDKDKPTSINQAELINTLLNIKLYPNWSYKNNTSEIILHPIIVCIDPFKKAPNILILCDTWTNDGKPTEFNLRYKANMLFRENIDIKTLITIKQDFYISDSHSELALGADDINEDCSYLTGYNKCVGRDKVDRILQLIIECGLPCYSFNSNSLKGSWNITIGPCEGLICADYIIILRYILNRVSELYKVDIKYDPTPIGSMENILTCSTNFYIELDNKNTQQKLTSYIDNLKNTHTNDIKVYSITNKSNSELTYSPDSIELIEDPFIKDKIYLSDNRPPADVNPYLVLKYILESTI